MKPEYQAILAKSAERREFIHKQLKYLGKFNIKNFDHVVHDYHEEAFARIDCLECGNCCRTVSPVFRESELKHIAKLTGMDQKRFAAEQLVFEEERGQVLRTLPCPFLGQENRCDIYEERPKSCADYPYTLERSIQKSLGRLARNTEFCPAACLVADRIIERYASGSKNA